MMYLLGPTEVEIGGTSAPELREALERASIQCNAYAEVLFEGLEVLEARSTRVVVERSAADLGLTRGGTYSEIVEGARRGGLSLCPLELAVHLRLRWLEQAAGPYLTVASPWPGQRTEASPCGLYLRRLDDGLWLRGYRASSDYVWPEESLFVFQTTPR